MAQGQQAQSWWHTVPGMLTGAAAVITAVTGLFLAFNQAGWLRRAAGAEESATLPNSVPVDAREVPAAPPSNKSASSLVPSVSEVTLGVVTFTLLDVQAQPLNPETNGLRINVRFHNRGSYSANFWNANFRLLVDDIPRAPTGTLNKVVEGNSAQEGDVEFTFPANARTLALQVRLGDEATEIGLQR